MTAGPAPVASPPAFDTSPQWNRGDKFLLDWVREHGLNPDDVSDMRALDDDGTRAEADIIVRNPDDSMQLAPDGRSVLTRPVPFEVTRPLPMSAVLFPENGRHHGLRIQGRPS